MGRIEKISKDYEIGTRDIALLAAWFGLVTGLVEGIGLMVDQHTGRLNSGPLLWVSAPIVWISPLACLLLFGCIGLSLVILQRLSAKTRGARLVIGVLCFLAIYDWMTVAAAGRIQHYALVMLSLGCAFTVARRFPGYELRMVRFSRHTLPWLIGAVPMLILGIEGGARLGEKIGENALPNTPANSPNILLIVLDAVRADHLSAYGYSRITSPHLDGIAEEGVLFENAFATSSWTLPSHTSLLTGRYLHEHLAGEQESNLDDRYPVISEYLKNRGYRTGAFSANTTFFSQGVGLGRGFIHFEDMFKSADDMWIRTAYGREFYNVLHRLGFVEDMPRHRRATEMVQSVLDWIDHNGSHPFFAMVNFIDAHEPYASPLRFNGRFSESRESNEFAHGRAKSVSSQSQTRINSYDSAIAYVDDEIGKLVGELRSSGKNTLVLVTADHGESLGGHGLFGHGNSLYREVIHVPLIIWWPGRVPSGLRLERSVTCATIPATILSLVGDIQQNLFPGPSLTNLWTPSSQPTDWPYPLAELHGSSHSKSLVNDGWHYIRDENLDVELYHWNRDPEELRNLALTPEGKIQVQDFSNHLNNLLSTRP